MALKTFKPYTKSTRGTVVLDKSSLWKGAPYKPLTKGQNFTGGRNNNGRITSRHMGGGSKHKYRIIDFYRKKKDMPATVERIEYDPNRTAYIALITYSDKEKSYIICPQGLKKGDIIEAGKKVDIVADVFWGSMHRQSELRGYRRRGKRVTSSLMSFCGACMGKGR